MDRRNFDPYVSRRTPTASFSAIGIWFRLLVLGGIVVVGSIAMLFEPERHWTIVAIAGLGGATLTLLAWQKLRDLLRSEDLPTADRATNERPATDAAFLGRS